MSDYSDSIGVESAGLPGPGLVSSSSAPTPSQVSSAWAQSDDRDDGASEQVAAAADQPIPSVELTDIQARVLGSMVEKCFQTPDAYPMTTNALTNACNQKSNRDPVVDYSAVQIDSTLLELRQRNLVRRVHAPGSRSTKHRQTLDEALSLSDQQLVLLSVLLLRGDQTLNELRIRTERHDVGFDDLGSVEACLESMASRSNPLVRELPRQSGHKENRWRHLISDPNAPFTNDAAPAAESTPTAPTATTSAPARTPPSSATASDPAMKARVDKLENQVAVLQRQLASLAEKLGEPLDDSTDALG